MRIAYTIPSDCLDLLAFANAFNVAPGSHLQYDLTGCICQVQSKVSHTGLDADIQVCAFKDVIYSGEADGNALINIDRPAGDLSCGETHSEGESGYEREAQHGARYRLGSVERPQTECRAIAWCGGGRRGIVGNMRFVLARREYHCANGSWLDNPRPIMSKKKLRCQHRLPNKSN